MSAMRLSCGVLICLCLVLAGCGKKNELGASTSESKLPTASESTDKVTFSDPVVGKGETAATGDTVWVFYTGKLKSGKVFDSKSGYDDPFMVTLGEGDVIKGWDQGLLGMRVGGERKLHVPSSLGYGPNGRTPEIPPNADLDFDVKLLGLVKVGQENVIDTKDLKAGTGRVAKAGDTVTIHYVGTLLNGKVFEDSKYFDKPYSFLLGAGHTLPCIDTGVVGMRVGGQRRITAPPMTAYTGKMVPGVSSDSEVIFTVDLLSIK